nr:PREDICTED: ankyrin-1-like isoform X2 [Latimeria chalumnae]|eukprot:XP_014347992.1 PREDICTED: ankyrin-1-like isoform X2 [Latimeria chalumnae]
MLWGRRLELAAGGEREGLGRESLIAFEKETVEVLKTKKQELIEGISNTDHLLDWLVDNAILTPDKKVLVSNYRTREEKNSRVLDILISRGERACRLFFYPCLKHVEPELYNNIRKYASSINVSVGDVRRQLVGYLLEKDKDGIPKSRQENVIKTTSKIIPSRKGSTIIRKDTEKSIPPASKPKGDSSKTDNIYEAVATGNLSYLEEVLKINNINEANTLNETLLHIAAANGHISVIQYLIEKGTKTDVRDSKGRSPLHRAAENGHVNAVKTLLQAGADIYAFNKESKAPLHVAAQNSHFSIVKILLDEEARVYKNRKNFLHLAALKDDSNLAQILLSNGAPVDAKDDEKKTALFHAVSHAFENTVKVLLEADAYVNSSIIDAAFNSNNQSIFSLIMQYAKGMSHATMVSALFKAVQKNLYGIIASLIDKGIKVNVRNEMEFTPLLLAAEMGKTEAAKILIEKGAKLDERLPNQNTALHLVAQGGNLSVAKLLLENGLNANIVGSGDQTPLHVVAFHNKPAVADILIRAGAKVNAVTKESSVTPLHIASQRGSFSAAQCLIQHRANVKAKDKHSKTPLHFAAAVGDYPMVELLLNNNADPNSTDKEKKTSLHVAAAEGHSDVVELMLAKKAKFGAKDMDGCTPMHYASIQGNTEVVKALLAAGKNKNVDDKNVWRKTSLHLAAECGHNDMAELLLSSGASLNSLDNNRDTPLHSACRAGDLPTVQMLVNWTQGKKGILQARNSRSKIPLEVAQSEGTHHHASIITFLKKKMLLIK